LSELSHPNQLHGLTVSQLEEIACQIRERHLEVVSTSGGHLGPGLGVVELTLALYQTLDLDFDKVVWDVGHQAYPHKLITGRFNDFDSLRQQKGIAGYLKRTESKFDHFGAGHASTSISAALGMAIARDRKGENHKCIAVIGDGALTGGMALEAINHAGHLPNTPLVVVLNDNDMSISPPVGALSTYLNRVRLSPPLQFLSDSVQESVKNIPLIGKDIPEELKNIKGSVRRLAVPKVGAVFEELGFTYMGPIDGHDISNLINTFNAAHRLKKPVLVHVVTTKGKGYPYAEADQVGYHAQSSFDLTTGKSIPSSKPKPVSYSKIFGQTLLKICEQDSKVIGITAAMATGTGLDLLQKSIPEQYIDVGMKKNINESNYTNKNMIAIACGANMNFERLRFVAERSALGEYKEAMFAVEIPEKAGSLINFCSLLNDRNLTEFSYRMSNSINAQIFVGIEVNGVEDKDKLLNEFIKSNYPFIDISNDELSKNHLRHMVGGRLPRKFTELEKSKHVELLYRFEFPERPGALINFLKNMKSNWTISIFHYRNHGSDVGKIVIGVLIDSAEINHWNKFVEFLGYKYWDETSNKTYKLFLGASD
ncbi:1-deoxy-D-xylulose-5-phosphate synthase, partial [Prochlorococcus sp. AH-716-E13]|nr:1-deoxy-D-xylulose-5-phosphate synthase [Prochlorococcus sp. AH-716-E13]